MRILVIDKDATEALGLFLPNNCLGHDVTVVAPANCSIQNIEKAVLEAKPDVLLISNDLPNGMSGVSVTAFLKGMGLTVRASLMGSVPEGFTLPCERRYKGIVVVNDVTALPFLEAGIVTAGKTGRTAEGLATALRRIIAPAPLATYRNFIRTGHSFEVPYVW